MTRPQPRGLEEAWPARVHAQVQDFTSADEFGPDHGPHTERGLAPWRRAAQRVNSGVVVGQEGIGHVELAALCCGEKLGVGGGDHSGDADE